jgi:hypothetical protein
VPTVAGADRREAAEFRRAPVPGRARAAGTPAAPTRADAAKAPVLAQRFANLAPAAESGRFVSGQAAMPILASFQIEQAGDQLRVIDSDGSTYLGKVVAPVPSAAGGSLNLAEALKRGPETIVTNTPSPVAPGVLYEVTGTNRTLNQPVRFVWSYLAPTNGPAQTLAPGAPVAPVPQLLNNSGVAGRARISAGPEIEIRARPVGP